jgi:hypothetical protein
MKFFTPELYVRFGSLDDDVADAANEEWERALKRYQRHYKKIAPHLPESLRHFHDEQCLHDADIVGPAWLSLCTLPWNAKDVVIVAQQVNTLLPEYLNTLAILQYAVTEDPVVEKPVTAAVFKAGQPNWLYEEVDLISPGVFQHEILISDGRVIRIRFHDFRYHIARLLPDVTAAEESPRKTDPSLSA